MWRRMLVPSLCGADVAFMDGRWQRRPGLDWRGPGRGQTDDHPVTCVSWKDAEAYVLAVTELVAAQVA